MHTVTHLEDSANYRYKVLEDLLHRAGITQEMLRGRVDIHHNDWILSDLEVTLSVNTSSPSLILTIPPTKIESKGLSPHELSFQEVDFARFDTKWRIHFKNSKKEPVTVLLVFKEVEKTAVSTEKLH